ncbi:MAG: SLBB domain-containing protein [Candidatus Kapaibacteriota bacterium]
MKKIAIIVFTLLIFTNFTKAQVTKGESPFENESKLQEEISKSLSDEMTKSAQSIPTGNIVDPKYYYIGPGDVFTLTISPVMPFPSIITVSPTTTITIPRFGDINLANKTIAQAQDTIQKFLQERNKDLTCVFSLQKPRICLVTIKGNVLFPNIYSVPASYQVSTAINYANKVNPERIPGSQFVAITNYNEQVRDKEKLFGSSKLSPVASYSSRNVLVFRNDGTSANVDIEKSKVLNDPQFNPYIREGDEIIVPFEFDNYQTISIAGEVNRPITLPYHNGDKISLLLKFGYGFTQNADLENIYLYTQENTQKIEVSKDGKLIGEDFELQPGNIIIVGTKAQKSENAIATVSIYGEVKRPGIYPIKNNQTSIKDIIAQCGGFTSDAHLPLSVIYRFDKIPQYKMDIKRDFNESFQYSNLTLDDTTRFLIDMQYPKNYVSCDFDKLFNKNDERFNVKLLNGDIIYIPKQPHQVYVFGQVKNPGYVEFEPNKTLEYYVEKAGGYADGAEPKRARIIRGRNLIWDKPDENTFVNAGDQVYIPRSPDLPVWLEIQKYGTYAAIVGTIGSLINIFYSIYLNSKK